MLTEFDPVKLSLDENRFIIERVGQPPVVALQGRPEQVTLAAVGPILQGVYEHIELKKADPGHQWVGVEAIKEAAKTYVDKALEWERRAKGPDGKLRKGAIRFPSMYAWDLRGRPHWRGIGSDYEFVKSYFDAEGNRIPFKISVIPQETEWQPEWTAPKTEEQKPWILVDNPEKNRIECPCGATETYKAESRASYNAARARISKHLRRATSFVEQHRELHTNEFGS